MSDLVILRNGPITWVVNRQKIPTQSSVEVETYITNEYVKELLWFYHIVHSMISDNIYLHPNKPIGLYIDNSGWVYGSKLSTAKIFWYITIRENTIQDSRLSQFSVQYIL